jgi:hypothetical protein
VVPDLEIELDRQELLQGRDGQHQAAIHYLGSRMKR